MQTVIPPSLAHIDFNTGVIADAVEVVVRRLSDMPDFFGDQNAVRELLKVDPVLYRVYNARQPGEAGGLYTGTTIIEPGRVGDEYFMTKGHFHTQQGAPEVYFTLGGNGMLVMQTRSGETVVQPMLSGSLHYIPGGWAHRTVNTGDVALIFFAAWPVSAGHDYDSVARDGLARLVLSGPDGPRVVSNPHYTQPC
jgi:glucose-6-phosphate isomerase